MSERRVIEEMLNAKISVIKIAAERGRPTSTLATETLKEDHGLKVSRGTLRKRMQDAGIWLSRR